MRNSDISSECALSICSEANQGCITQEKAQYRDAFDRLRGLKTEIEHRQRIAGQDRARYRVDFGPWLAVMRRQAGLPAPTEAELVGDPDAHDSTRGASHAAAAGSRETLPTALESAVSDRSEVMMPGHDARAAEQATAAGAQRSVPAADEPALHAQHFRHKAEVVQVGLEPGPRQQDGGRALHAAGTVVQPRDLQDVLQTAAGVVAANESPGFHARRLPPSNSGSSADPPEPPPPQPAADPYADVDPEVLRAAKPMLTGNPAADRSIIQFYEARAALLRSQAFRRTL